MECVRDEIDPATGLRRGHCGCDDCADVRRELHVVDNAEISLREIVVKLLEHGWMPTEIADAVRRRTPKRSRAWMLTRVELTCQAGYWLSRPAWYGHLEQVDELSKYTGFYVGVTIPGWMRHWFVDKGGHDLHRLTESVLDVSIAMGPDVPDVDIVEACGVDGFGVENGTTSNVIAFPERRW